MVLGVREVQVTDVWVQDLTQLVCSDCGQIIDYEVGLYKYHF